MNRRQKSLIVNFIVVGLVTTSFIVIMANVKDLLNKSEAMRAMQYVGEQVLKYRTQYGALPPQSYLGPIKEQFVRLGELQYRAQWIGFDSGPDTILAYSERRYYSLILRPGYIVLRLNGTVEWMGKKEFERLLHTQQTEEEMQMLGRR